MKKINLIIILAFISSFYSCDKDNDDTETKKSSLNGYTFNSEFFPTNRLILTAFGPGEVVFLLLDDTAIFNSTTGEFEGDSGRGIIIAISNENVSELKDLVGTYTNVLEDPNDDYEEGDFRGGLFMGLQGLEIEHEDKGIANAVQSDAGEVRVSFNSETEIFTIEYTLTTNQGTITGFYEDVSQIYQMEDD